MAVRKIKNSWWIDFRFNHVRYRKRSPENSKAGALAYEAVLRQKLARGEVIDERSGKPKEHEQTFEQFAGKWFRDYVKPNNKFSEIKTKKNILDAHLIPFFGKRSINKITTQHVEQYKSQQKKKDLKNKTINNQLTVLSTCLKTAEEWLIELEKIPKIKWLKNSPVKTDFLSREECELLLIHAKGVWCEMILTVLKTGLRRGELKALQWQDINWNNWILTVRHSYCEVRKGLVSPKSNKERHIPLDAGVYALLYQRKKKSGFVFVNGNNSPFDTKTLSLTLKQISGKAGLRNVYWHMLRHTFASHLAMANAPLTAIQALLGHASITTTMRYAHLSPATLRATVDLLNSKGIDLTFGQPVVNHRYVMAPQLGNEKTPVLQKALGDKSFFENRNP